MSREIGSEAAFQQTTEAGREERETKKEMPVMTLYLLRHGESDEDKTNPKRGLTRHGVEQVQASLSRVVAEISGEENPNAETPKDALAKLKFNLRDSGTDRTNQQVWVEYDALINAGVSPENINLPDAAFKYLQGVRQVLDSAESAASRPYFPEAVIKHLDMAEMSSGPGVARRLKGVQGLDTNPEFRKKIKTPQFQEKVGATSDVMAWAKAPEDEIPEGVETQAQMEARYQKDIAKTTRVINARLDGSPQRYITIANSHASIATLAAASELDVPLDELMGKVGEMPEAQGLRYDFYGADKAHTTKPFGPEIEKAVAEMKEVK